MLGIGIPAESPASSGPDAHHWVLVMVVMMVVMRVVMMVVMRVVMIVMVMRRVVMMVVVAGDGGCGNV